MSGLVLFVCAVVIAATWSLMGSLYREGTVTAIVLIALIGIRRVIFSADLMRTIARCSPMRLSRAIQVSRSSRSAIEPIDDSETWLAGRLSGQ